MALKLAILVALSSFDSYFLYASFVQTMYKITQDMPEKGL